MDIPIGEFEAIIEEGVVGEEGAYLVRVEGLRENQPVRNDCYVNAPGLVESFEKSGLNHEAYLTGQCGAVFVKMLWMMPLPKRACLPRSNLMPMPAVIALKSLPSWILRLIRS